MYYSFALLSCLFPVTESIILFILAIHRKYPVNFFQMENYPFCEGNVTSLCKEGEVGKYVEFGLFVRNGQGKPPKKNTVGRIKRKMKCQSTSCAKSFNFGDEEDGDELVAASQVSHVLQGGGEDSL